VDINNLVSLEFMLPMSLIDLDLAGTSSFVVRKGREDEAYVFNPSGQILALADLLLTASLPGDSQATKVHAGSRRLAGIVYAPAELADEAAAAAGRMADLLSRFGAVQTAHGVR
jgi:DNA/RNA-binding domain of Phe-tRNA-synthetase-like protein